MLTIHNYTKGKKRTEPSNAFEQHQTIMLVLYYIHFSQDSSV